MAFVHVHVSFVFSHSGFFYLLTCLVAVVRQYWP